MNNDAPDRPTKQAARPKTLATLKNNECRWPIGDPQQPGFHFCGEPKKDGQSYCDKHATQASTTSRPRAVSYRRGG